MSFSTFAPTWSPTRLSDLPLPARWDAVRRHQGGTHEWPRKTSAVSRAAPEPMTRRIFLSRSGPPPIPGPLRCGHTASASSPPARLLFNLTLLTTMAVYLRRQSASFAVSDSRQLASTLTLWTSVSPLLPRGIGRMPTASRTRSRASSPSCTAPPSHSHVHRKSTRISNPRNIRRRGNTRLPVTQQVIE